MNKNYSMLFIVLGLFLLVHFISAKANKVLLNAEAFGFGPSAAITELFPYLRKNIDHLSYIGTGHTLDLQRNLPYNKVYDYRATDIEQQKMNFNAIAQHYDVFITASNYEAAEWAKALGLKLIIYDPLTWYWQALPAVISQAHLYIAQNFFGVTERIKNEREKFPESVIISALVPDFNRYQAPNQSVALVNLGGLSNPFIPNEDLIVFAKMVFASAHDALGTKYDDVEYVTSAAIVQATQNMYPTKTVQPQQVQKILSDSKIAIMTSGLGNIYEASVLQKFVIWLPAANDSQGQQIKLLKKHNMVDFSIDWHEFLEDETPIDYCAPQQETLKRIARCMQKLSTNPKAQEKFKALLQNALTSIESNSSAKPALAQLAQLFGTGGAQQAAEAILKKLNEKHESAD